MMVRSMKIKVYIIAVFLVLIALPVYASNQDLPLVNRVLSNANSLEDFNVPLGYYIIDVGEYPITKKVDAIGYIPDSFLVVKADSRELRRLMQNNIAERIWHYTSPYNYDPSLNSMQINDIIDIKILLFESVDSKKILKTLKNLGAIAYSDSSLILMKTSFGNIQKISNIEGIQFIERYEIPQILNDLTNIVNGNSDFRNNWKLFGDDQIIAIGDTGLDTGVNDPSMHDDFEGRIQAIVDVANIVLTSGSPPACPPICSTTSADLNGHGTHVSGSALANGVRSGSNPLLNIYSGSYAGVAPKSKIVVVDIASDDPLSSQVYPGTMSVHYLPNGYNYGARVMSGSWALTSQTWAGLYSIESLFLDSYAYTHPDLVVTQAAGNYGPSSYSVRPPSTAKNAISVGANYKNNVNTLWSASSVGPTNDSRYKPDLIAPGVLTTSTKSSVASNPSGCASNSVNQYYSICTGTSMATPVIAGLAALAREYFQKIKGIANPSAALIKAALINGAEDMGYGIPNFNTGWGRANISSTFPSYGITVPTAVSSAKEVYVVDNPLSFTSSGQEYQFNIYPNPGKKIKATLVWTDKQATVITPQTAAKLVNDLDLIVTDPLGTIYNGNDFTPPYNDQSDRLNNVEQIRIDNTLSGQYNFKVRAFNIPSASSPQSFSVFINYEISPPSITPSGSPTAGSTMNFIIIDQNHPNAQYMFLMSLSSAGIPLGDGRIVPLAGDAVFFLTAFYASLIGIPNSVGTLNSQGLATVTWNVPSYVIPGIMLYASAILLNPSVSLPQNIIAISPAISFATV